MPRSAGGIMALSSYSIFTGSVCSVSPRRRLNRVTCVSTGKPGSPSATLRTTFPPISLPKRDVSEPIFNHGPGGTREIVHPGNREYVKGDRIPRPQGGAGGSGGRGASPDGQGEDDFVFRITREEFMNYFFDDLALPRLIRTQLLADVPEWKTRRAGPSGGSSAA